MKKTVIILSLVFVSITAMAQTKATPVKPIKVGNAKIAMTATPPLFIKNSKDSAS